MSWTEMLYRSGAGAMPADATLQKQEMTDPALLPDPSTYGGRGAGFTGLAHKDYQIGELMDRTPDKPYLESDQPRRDPALSRTVLNLRFNGSRGSSGELPRHPELFLGFTGNDPRGADNVPRFDKLRAQMEHRARQLEVRMGSSVGHDGHQEAERPFTGPALQKARVDMHKQARRRLKVFSTSKDGRSTGRNMVADDFYNVRQRAQALESGDEQWRPHEGPRSDQSVGGLLTQKPTVQHLPSYNGVKLWKRSSGDMSLGVAQYGQTRRTRALQGAGKEGLRSARSAAGEQQGLGVPTDDANLSALRAGGPQSHRVLAATMSTAAQHRRTQAERSTERADTEMGAQHTAQPAKSTDPRGQDVTRAYRQLKYDQDMGKSTPNDLRGRVAGGGMMPSLDPRAVAGRGATDHNVATLAANMANAGRKHGASHQDKNTDITRARYQALAAGARPTPVSEKEISPLGGHQVPTATGGNDAARQQTQTPLARAAASQELEVQNYTGATPVEAGLNLATTASHYGTHAAAAAQGIQNTNTQQDRPRYRGFTQVAGSTQLGAPDTETFGLDASGRSSDMTKGLRMGRKAVRYDRLAAAGGDRLGGDHLVEAF